MQNFCKMENFILVSIHKSCIIYFEKICCADRSWNFIFWSWKSHGKSLLKKSGHPVIDCSSCVDTAEVSVCAGLNGWHQRHKTVQLPSCPSLSVPLTLTTTVTPPALSCQSLSTAVICLALLCFSSVL